MKTNVEKCHQLDRQYIYIYSLLHRDRVKYSFLRNFSFSNNVSTVISCIGISPFPLIDAFLRFCSRQLFENKATKEEIAPNEQLIFFCHHVSNSLGTEFPIFFGYVFKLHVVCCRFSECGKGLVCKRDRVRHLHWVKYFHLCGIYFIMGIQQKCWDVLTRINPHYICIHFIMI